MPRVIFITHDEVKYVVEVPAGKSLMQAAVENGIPGIDADCGGMCACATCHVFVEDPWLARLDPPMPMENEMLSFTAVASTYSRLACQVMLSTELDGIVVTLPENQH